MPPQPFGPEGAAPAVVAQRHHRHALPGVVIVRAPLQFYSQLVVPVHQHVGFDDDVVAHQPLHGKAAVVHGRSHVFDGDARRGHGGAGAPAVCIARDCPLPAGRHDGAPPDRTAAEHAPGLHAARRQVDLRQRARLGAQGLVAAAGRLGQQVERHAAREAARHAGQEAVRLRRDAGVQVGVDDQQRRRIVRPQVGAVGAQQGAHACVGAGQHAQVRARGHRAGGLRGTQRRVHVAHRVGQVEGRMRVDPLRVGRVAAIGLHRQQRAALEAERHQPAGTQHVRHVEHAPVGPLARHGIAEGLAVARAERRLHRGDGRRDGGQPRVFLHHPAGAEIPPAQRREGGIEAGVGQGLDGPAVQARRPGQEAHRPRAGGLARGRDQRVPARRRQAGRRLAAEAADAERRPRAQLLHPPRADGLGAMRVVVAERGHLQVRRRQARVQRVAVLGAAVEPAGVVGAQRGVGRHAVDHQVHQQGQAALPASVGQPAQRRMCGSAAERGMQPRVVARDEHVAARAHRKRRRDQHVVEAERGDAVQQTAPLVERTLLQGMEIADRRRECRRAPLRLGPGVRGCRGRCLRGRLRGGRLLRVFRRAGRRGGRGAGGGCRERLRIGHASVPLER